MDIFTAGGGEVAEERNVNITGRVVRYLSFCGLFGMEAADERPLIPQTKHKKSNKCADAPESAPFHLPENLPTLSSCTRNQNQKQFGPQRWR